MMNDNKTQFIIIDTWQQLIKVNLSHITICDLACVASAKGEGGGGQKIRKKEGRRGGTGEERREGSPCSHAIVFFITPTFHYPIKMKPNLFVYFCFRMNCLTSADVQDFLHVGRYTNVDDKRYEIERK